MNERKSAFFMMCLLVCIWGMDYIFAKEALEILQPLTLLFLKYSLGFLLVLAVKLRTDGRTLIRRKDLPVLILCSITGEIIYYFCEYSAMSYIPVSLITILLAFVPAVSIIIERIVFKRKFSVKMLLGVLPCIFGVAVVIGADLKILLQGRIFGYVLAFGAVLAWNAYNFLTDFLNEKYSGPTIAFSQMLCTIILIMPYAIHTMPSIETFTPGVIGGIIYLGLVSAGPGFLITIRGLKVLGPTISAMFSNFLPVTATFFGWIFLGESLSIMQVVGGVVVIVSSCIVITEKGKMEERLDDGEAEPDNVD